MHSRGFALSAFSLMLLLMPYLCHKFWSYAFIKEHKNVPLTDVAHASAHIIATFYGVILTEKNSCMTMFHILACQLQTGHARVFWLQTICQKHAHLRIFSSYRYNMGTIYSKKYFLSLIKNYCKVPGVLLYPK
jgi:hypothetical protein